VVKCDGKVFKKKKRIYRKKDRSLGNGNSICSWCVGFGREGCPRTFLLIESLPVRGEWKGKGSPMSPGKKMQRSLHLSRTKVKDTSLWLTTDKKKKGEEGRGRTWEPFGWDGKGGERGESLVFSTTWLRKTGNNWERE